MLKDALLEKEEKLRALIHDARRVVIGYSGGVDSTYLAKVAHEVLGENVLLVTTVSETNASVELAEMEAFVARYQIPHLVVETSELSIPGYAENPVNRCYFCKELLYRQLWKVAKEQGYLAVFDGSNADDSRDYRPGRQAAVDYEARSPLLEVGLTKAEIRVRSRELGLPTADKPSSPCLSSRIPYGEVITSEKIEQVRAGENFLRGLGFREFRVRHHGESVRLEVAPEAFSLLLEKRVELIGFFRDLGFHYVVLDLEGFRSGRLNEVLAPHEREKYTHVT